MKITANTKHYGHMFAARRKNTVDPLVDERRRAVYDGCRKLSNYYLKLKSSIILYYYIHYTSMCIYR